MATQANFLSMVNGLATALQSNALIGNFLSMTNLVTTMGNNDVLASVTHGGVVTKNLPAAPATGEIHIIYDATFNAGTFNITISGNGKNFINNLASPGGTQTVINVNGGCTCVLYNGTAWVILFFTGGAVP